MMLRRSALLALLIALVLGARPGASQQAASQQAAPAKLTPLTVDAYNRLIASHKGRVVLVDFWATYCVPCRTEIPELVKLAAQLRPRGLDLIVVSADEPEQEPQARKFISGKAPAPLYIKSADDNDKYVAAIHPRWEGELPANFVFDRTGKKVKVFIGEVPTKDIEAVIEKLL
jgi:thiol-disulfide isomerase/thioredoxin